MKKLITFLFLIQSTICLAADLRVDANGDAYIKQPGKPNSRVLNEGSTFYRDTNSTHEASAVCTDTGTASTEDMQVYISRVGNSIALSFGRAGTSGHMDNISCTTASSGLIVYSSVIPADFDASWQGTGNISFPVWCIENSVSGVCRVDVQPDGGIRFVNQSGTNFASGISVSILPMTITWTSSD